jgi:RecB family endonuclease NucS
MEEPSPVQFAYETDLRNFLSKNLNLIESGLSLYNDEGINGIEFPACGRFIDLLAVSIENDLVVIELKVSRGYDRVVGQLLRYVGWIKENLAEGDQRVRGVIVARSISEDLQLACGGLPDISLFEYELSVQLSRVS